MAEPVDVIGYGTRRPRWRKVAFWSLAAAAVGVLVVGWSSPALRERALVEFKYRRCLSYSPPAGHVVYTMEPREVERLLHAAGYRLHHGAETRSRKAAFYPPVQESYNRHFTGSHRPIGGVAFFHGRRPCGGGETHLVGVVVSAWRDLVVFAAQSGVRPNGIGDADPYSTRHKLPPGIVLQEGDALRVFAGRPDPADASRFEIEFEMNGVRNALGGRLRDDGSVELRPLTGRLVHYGGRLDAAWCPDGSHREPSALDTGISLGTERQ